MTEYSEQTALLATGRRVRTMDPAWRYMVAAVIGALVVGLLVGCSASTTETDGWMPMRGPMHPMMGSHSETDAGPAPTFPNAVKITVEAGDLWFDTTTIEIVAGEPVNLTLANHGQLFHDLVIEELDVRLVADAGATTTSGLLVDQPGEYEFICSVPGHAAAGMRGAIVVRPAAS